MERHATRTSRPTDDTGTDRSHTDRPATDRPTTDRSHTDQPHSGHPRAGWRSRWAALGAATAVTLGAGGIALVDATSSPASVFIAVTPERVLDTRIGIGLTGPLISPEPRDLQITGTVPTPNGNQTIVPTGATAVVLNVTILEPQADGFASIRPTGTPGTPTTSNLNFTAGTSIPNAVTVALPTNGQIELTYNAFNTPGPTTHMLIDITGYYTTAGGGSGGGTAATGEPGPKGDPGPRGPKGDPGAPAVDPANVLWVATSGDNTYPTLTAALDAITENSQANPYLIKIAPGTYTEPGPIELKTFVNIEGSGLTTTALACECGSSTATDAFIRAGSVVVGEMRHLTILNAGGGDFSTGISIGLGFEQRFSMSHLRVVAGNGAIASYGIYNQAPTTMSDLEVISLGDATSVAIANVFGRSSTMTNVSARALALSPIGSTATGVWNNANETSSMTNVTAAALGGATSRGVWNQNSSPTMTDVEATASEAPDAIGIQNEQSSSPTMTNVRAIAEEADRAIGIQNESSSTPTMNNVTATADGSFESIGINNNGSTPEMFNVTATATGTGVSSVGVNNQSSSPTMDNVTATATGGSGSNTGVRNDGSSPTMRNTTISATGGSNAWAVNNLNSSPTMNNVDIRASGGSTNSYGIRNASGSSPRIRSSSINGTTFAVFNEGGNSARIAHSSITTAVSGPGYTCVRVHNHNFVELGTACQ